MTSTLNPPARYAGSATIAGRCRNFRIREDHRRPAGPANRRLRDTAPPAASSSRRPDPASGPSRTTREVTAMTVTRQPRAGQPMTAARRALRALKYATDELMRASDAIIRSARAPQPRPPGTCTQTGVSASRPCRRNAPTEQPDPPGRSVLRRRKAVPRVIWLRLGGACRQACGRAAGRQRSPAGQMARAGMLPIGPGPARGGRRPCACLAGQPPGFPPDQQRDHQADRHRRDQPDPGQP
jgi:hypothetical protein